jgi:hypothetical protein
MGNLRRFTLATASVSLVCCFTNVALAVSYRVVAKSGDNAPGWAGATFSRFGLPKLNNAGQVTFFANSSELNSTALFSEGGGNLHAVAYPGMTAQDAGPGVRISGVSPDLILGSNTPIINAAGDVVFRAELFGTNVTTSNNDALWIERDGQLQLVAREGSPAAGTDADVVFSELLTPVLNDAGTVVFPAKLAGPGISSLTDHGIWLQDHGNTVLVARDGSPTPGTVAGETFGDLGSSRPLVNAAGEVAFRAYVLITPTNFDLGIWKGIPGNLQLVARDGMQAPGAVSGTTFSSLERPTLNNNGEVAFGAQLAGAVTETTDTGIWSDRGGSLQPIAREGAAPFNSSPYEYDFFEPSIASNGKVTFNATPRLYGLAQTIWSDDGSGPHLVASQYDDAPGSPGDKLGLFHLATINGTGQIVFFSELNANIYNDSINDTAIWAHTPAGLTMIARKDQLFEVSPGEFRTINRLHLFVGPGNETGHASAFNDRGQLVFRATFTDGSSAIIVAGVVPEPGALHLAMIGGLIAAVQRCRPARGLL